MTEAQKNKIKRMRQKGSTYPAIAAAVGVKENTVKTYCWRNRIEVLAISAVEAVKPNYCLNCGKALAQKEKTKPKKFCCVKCRNHWWNNNRLLVNQGSFRRAFCAQCGTEFQKYENGTKRYCSHNCYIIARFGEVKVNG